MKERSREAKEGSTSYWHSDAERVFEPGGAIGKPITHIRHVEKPCFDAWLRIWILKEQRI